MSNPHTFPEIHDYSPQQIRHYFGGKALGLYEAYKIGIAIPPTWLISAQEHEDFLRQNPPSDPLLFQQAAIPYIQEHLHHFLASLEEGNYTVRSSHHFLASLEEENYAVRSSCQIEDSSHHSFAGIFETCLNIPKQEIAQAIAYVWSSPLHERAKAYSKIHSYMGVLIQPMVEAKFAGICFTVHPSPKTLFENGSIVVEYAPTSGEKVVQGEVIPFRLTGTADGLSAASEHDWIDELLKAIFELKKYYPHEADIEFAIDSDDKFWLLQQRPISKVFRSQAIDLAKYKRLYKRALLSLDAELLIDGCARFLSAYLEIPTPLDQWMIMTTSNQGIQELWVNEILNETIIDAVIAKITHDKTYLQRLNKRYSDHHRRLVSTDLASCCNPNAPLHDRLFQWFEWITPFTAHYYVPIFIIDALYTSILREIRPLNPTHADRDLFELGTAGIASLIDLLNKELRAFKKCRSFEECASQLQHLAQRFGFLNCRQVFEDPYTAEDLFAMIDEVSEEPSTFDERAFEEKKQLYFHNEHLEHRLNALREWMRIRNQEMEYLLFAFLTARPMIEEVCSTLSIVPEDFWRSSKNTLLTALEANQPLKPTPVENLTILKSHGQTILSDQIELQQQNPDRCSDLKGRTVYGKGIIEATVKIAFTPENLSTPPERPCVLVTGMTTPDFVPLIRKYFDALITDEGGILCHAAIVAREIPIPCIVGTGVGSSILSNGSKVRIDFDRAEIKVLS